MWKIRVYATKNNVYNMSIYALFFHTHSLQYFSSLKKTVIFHMKKKQLSKNPLIYIHKIAIHLYTVIIMKSSIVYI